MFKILVPILLVFFFGSENKKGEFHYQRALECVKDQECDKAFSHFLEALTHLCPKSPPLISSEEKKVYEAALDDYMRGASSDPFAVAKEMVETYGAVAADHKEKWIHLNFLLATAYANLGQYDTFLSQFYRGYPYFADSFIAYKTRGILCLRLAKHGRSADERQQHQKEARHYLTEALERNPQDASLYKVLIFLAKDEKNDALVLNYLQKMVDERAPIARSDIYRYVKEGVRLRSAAFGQQIFDLASSQYEYSRALLAAQEYLNQCRG